MQIRSQQQPSKNPLITQALPQPLRSEQEKTNQFSQINMLRAEKSSDAIFDKKFIHAAQNFAAYL